MLNLIELFRRLGEQEEGVSFFWSQTDEGWKRRLAWNPVATFEGMAKDLAAFVKEHEGKLVVGALSYEGNPHFFAYDTWLEEDSELTSELERILERDPVFDDSPLDFVPQVSEVDYKSAFNRVKKYIISGDVYQMNLTLKFESSFRGDSKGLFCRLIEENPVNFMAYLELDGLTLLSASPERFISTKEDEIHTYPIKGTIARGTSREEDEIQRKRLLEDTKEAAELNMITDLLRNDIGKVSQSGTVEVVEHRVARPFPAIWHTFSHVKGRLAVEPIDALLSMAPGGSITGCPKKRAMEIIEELEWCPRGFYTGTIGFIDPHGDLDFNIAIRTLILQNQNLALQVGGGLVYDSQVENEWQEIFNKAKPFLLL